MLLLKMLTIKSWTISCRQAISFRMCLRGLKNDASSVITNSIFEESFTFLQVRSGSLYLLAVLTSVQQFFKIRSFHQLNSTVQHVKFVLDFPAADQVRHRRKTDS